MKVRVARPDAATVFSLSREAPAKYQIEVGEFG
jgi:hypothetical protein